MFESNRVNHDDDDVHGNNDSDEGVGNDYKDDIVAGQTKIYFPYGFHLAQINFVETFYTNF